MTQYQLIIKYIEYHGSITPARMGGRIYCDIMFGAETSKRCRELRAKNILRSEKDGRFQRFFLIPIQENPAIKEIKEILKNERIKNYNPQIQLL